MPANKRMAFVDHALAEHRGGDGNAGLLGEFQQRTLQTETVDLDAGQDDRPLGRRDAAGRFAHRLAKRLGIARRLLPGGDVRTVGNDAHQVARQLDIARLSMTHYGRQYAVDVRQGRVRIVQLRHGAADVAEHVGLGAKILHAMVQQRVVEPLAHPGRAAEHDHRRFLGIGPRDRVAHA